MLQSVEVQQQQASEAAAAAADVTGARAGPRPARVSPRARSVVQVRTLTRSISRESIAWVYESRLEGNTLYFGTGQHLTPFKGNAL